MRTTQQKLYEALGYLYYSIAHADKKITAPEIEALSAAVKEQWVPLEDSTDDFGTDAAYYISICFDIMNDKDVSPEKAWVSFINFYEAHPSLFNPHIKDRMLKTADAIVKASSGMNHAEHERLQSLKSLLKT